jgi:hypothetical protein
MGAIKGNGKISGKTEKELLRQGVPESDDEDWGGHHWPEENENGLVKEEDDSLDDEDHITSHHLHTGFIFKAQIKFRATI